MFWTPIVPHVKECITILHTLDCGRAVLNSDLKKISLQSQDRLSPIFLWCYYMIIYIFKRTNLNILMRTNLKWYICITYNNWKCWKMSWILFFSDPTLMTMATVCGQTVLRSYSQLSGSHVKVSESWSWLEQNHFVTCQNLHKNHQVCHARGRIRIVFIMDLKFSCWQHQNCRVCTEKKVYTKFIGKFHRSMD